MSPAVKLWTIHFLDFVIDRYVFRHRWYWLCDRIAMSSWWGREKCECRRCAGVREEMGLR